MSEKRASMDREEADQPKGGGATGGAFLKARGNQGHQEAGDNQEWSPTKEADDPSEEFQDKLKV
jgi:hypothetical protein